MNRCFDPVEITGVRGLSAQLFHHPKGIIIIILCLLVFAWSKKLRSVAEIIQIREVERTPRCVVGMCLFFSSGEVDCLLVDCHRPGVFCLALVLCNIWPPSAKNRVTDEKVTIMKLLLKRRIAVATLELSFDQAACFFRLL